MAARTAIIPDGDPAPVGFALTPEAHALLSHAGLPGILSAVTYDRSNREGTAIVQGELVAQDPTTAKGLRRFDPTTDNTFSRPVGVVADVSIGASATGGITTVHGFSLPVLLVPGLTPVLGDLVIGSTVPGSSTLPGSGVSEPTAVGNVVQSVGHIIDVLTYDGVSDLLVLVQINFGWRRIA